VRERLSAFIRLMING